MKAVEVSKLVKYYNSFQALKGISFEVKEGEIFGLIGPNGSGKTTTLRILSTLLKPSSGSVKVFEHDIVKEADSVRLCISYLPEDAGAYKELTGIDYLRFVARFFVKDEVKLKQMVEKGIQMTNLGDKIRSKVATYSKGMTRRLLIARALMVNPKLAILDEPTSGLDVLSAQEVRKMIKDYVKNGGTVLLSSHNMLEVEFLCDQIALIHNGQIVRTGNPAELKKEYNASNIEEVFIEVVRCSGIC